VHGASGRDDLNALSWSTSTRTRRRSWLLGGSEPAIHRPTDMRPRLLVLVTGTDSGVGKTWVSAELLRRVSGAGWSVSARLPAQTYLRDDATTDADALAEATGETPTEVCPPTRWYGVPVAPPMAAEVLGLPAILLADLEREVGSGWPLTPVDVGLIGSSGGVASPLASNGDVAELARNLGADLAVVVARADVGAINSLRLSHDVLSPLPVIVYLNRFNKEDELHLQVYEWLTKHDGFAVTTEMQVLVDLVAGQLASQA
jgi:dethiobiotin synthetase